MPLRTFDPYRLRLLLVVFFWVLLAGAGLLYGWLWFAGPADIRAARLFDETGSCAQAPPPDCKLEVGGKIVDKREIHLGRTPATYRLSVVADQGQPSFSGPIHWTTGDFDRLRAGERVTLRYYRAQLTDVLTPEGAFRTDANPHQQALQDEALVQALEWTVPIPLLPLGVFLLVTRGRRSGYSG